MSSHLLFLFPSYQTVTRRPSIPKRLSLSALSVQLVWPRTPSPSVFIEMSVMNYIDAGFPASSPAEALVCVCVCVCGSSHIPLHLTAKARVRNANHDCHTHKPTKVMKWEHAQLNVFCYTRKCQVFYYESQSVVWVEWMKSFQRIPLFPFTAPNPIWKLVCVPCLFIYIVSTLGQCAHLL